METKIRKTRKELLDMQHRGHLRCCYFIEDNKVMSDLMTDMIKFDTKVQMLVGDELKQDQFEFFYDSVKVLYDSAL